MTSFDYRLNPIYAIKECSTCGVLYTADFCCSNKGLEDKILVPKPPRNCARCGTPVDGPYCQGCALLRKKFKEDLFTYCVENEFFKDLQDASESSNDNTNVVKAPSRPTMESGGGGGTPVKIPHQASSTTLTIVCHIHDEDDTIAITPVLPIEEPDNSLSMGDEHLDTIPTTESDEVIKSSVEDLVPIPSESEGIPDKMCDVPLCENTTPLNTLNEHSEIVVNSDDENLNLEVVEIVDPEPDPGELTSIDLRIRKNVSTTNVNLPLEDDQSFLFAYVVMILSCLFLRNSRVVPPYLLSTRNEDTIFDPGISIYHSFMPDVSHRSGTFIKFNVYPNRLNESPMMILSSTCSPMDQ
ncbi:hypothetical protein Tco_1034300 [Tanacetum coccineum]